ncbi:hypothetical protein AAG570_013691 [Ranatra chinensis]|uniref:Uncharacterized protein n=1 Tax=Ranatra chinensis TaxID=642074 RepID=A0ABD0YCY3_9HEMI
MSTNRNRFGSTNSEQEASFYETDGSFFESYTAVSWKLENRRLMTMQETGPTPQTPSPPPASLGVKPPPELRLHHKEIDNILIPPTNHVHYLGLDVDEKDYLEPSDLTEKTRPKQEIQTIN